MPPSLHPSNEASDDSELADTEPPAAAPKEENERSAGQVGADPPTSEGAIATMDVGAGAPLQSKCKAKVEEGGAQKRLIDELRLERVKGLRRTRGFHDSVLNLTPNQTLAVGTRYSNQHIFGMCSEDFNNVAYLGECSEADFMAANGGKVGALSKQPRRRGALALPRKEAGSEWWVGLGRKVPMHVLLVVVVIPPRRHRLTA